MLNKQLRNFSVFNLITAVQADWKIKILTDVIIKNIFFNIN